MRFIILFFFSIITLTASAQFWKTKKPEPVRYELLDEALANFEVSVTPLTYTMPAVKPIELKRSIFNIICLEDAALKDAKHYMRFRMYKEASYSFSELAELYMLQRRFSEAKWYLLQSNEISRVQNADEHTIANLLDLAAIKIAIGEPALAKVDLQEAHVLANLKGFTGDAAIIEKKITELQLIKATSSKVELHYAEAVELAAKGQ